MSSVRKPPRAEPHASAARVIQELAEMLGKLAPDLDTCAQLSWTCGPTLEKLIVLPCSDRVLRLSVGVRIEAGCTGTCNLWIEP